MTSGVENNVHDIGRTGEIPAHTPLSDNPSRPKGRRPKREPQRDKRSKDPLAPKPEAESGDHKKHDDHEIDYYA